MNSQESNAQEKIFIFGCGSKSMRALPALALHYDVIGFIDSGVVQNNQHFLGKPLISPSMLTNYTFDLIVIASSFDNEIKSLLEKNNVHNFTTLECLPNIDKSAENYHRHFGDTQERVLGTTKQLEQRHLEGTKLLTNRVELLKKLPKNMKCVELGVANGDFSRQIITHLQPSFLALVDLWDSDRYSEKMYQAVSEHFKNEPCCDVKIYRTSSIDACQQFEDGSLDFVYIDTTHSYSTTKSELQLYSKKLKPGGILAGHDFSQGNWSKRSRYGVIEAVYDFCIESNWRLDYLTMDINERQSFALLRN
jgi:SAM-dependent methyltransferase